MKTSSYNANSDLFFSFAFLVISILFTASMIAIYLADKPEPKRAPAIQLNHCDVVGSTVIGKGGAHLDGYVVVECGKRTRYAIPEADFQRHLESADGKLSTTSAMEVY